MRVTGEVVANSPASSWWRPNRCQPSTDQRELSGRVATLSIRSAVEVLPPWCGRRETPTLCWGRLMRLKTSSRAMRSEDPLPGARDLKRRIALGCVLASLCLVRFSSWETRLQIVFRPDREKHSEKSTSENRLRIYADAKPQPRSRLNMRVRL